ncbi:MAG TPA: hypothetical protein VM327_00425 [Candidatus Thermoplasmatota archaeon]|nr:hypothetical protein [Candidatus Thermoplasmatota archaeon]
MDGSWFQVVAEGMASLLALGLAWAVARLGHGEQNRGLVGLLLVEGLDQAAWTLADLTATPTDRTVADLFVAAGILGFVLTVPFYLAILRGLQTPLSAPLRRRGMLSVVGVSVVVLAAWPIAWILQHPGSFSFTQPNAPPLLAGILAVGLLMVLVFGFALLVALSAFRRAAVGSGAQGKARAYAVAFGVRDGLYVLAIALNIVAVGALGHTEWQPYTYPIWSFASIAFALLLVYGVLRTQLFDIDLKLKIGIRRGTVVAIFVIAVFIAFQIAQQYLNRTYGIVASGMVTGTLLFLSPRLNKLADKVSDKALPGVSGSSDYLAYKKLEVYRAALEGAVETGTVSTRERAMLERMRVKLGLAQGDVAALEAEVQAEVATPPAAPSAT